MLFNLYKRFFHKNNGRQGCGFERSFFHQNYVSLDVFSVSYRKYLQLDNLSWVSSRFHDWNWSGAALWNPSEFFNQGNKSWIWKQVDVLWKLKKRLREKKKRKAANSEIRVRVAFCWRIFTQKFEFSEVRKQKLAFWKNRWKPYRKTQSYKTTNSEESNRKVITVGSSWLVGFYSAYQESMGMIQTSRFRLECSSTSGNVKYRNCFQVP